MKKIRKNTFSVLVAALSIVLALITVVYAVVLFSFRVDGKIDGNTDTINSEELLNLEVTETSVSFAKAGEEGRKNISLTVKNDTNVNIAYSFGLSADNNSLTESQFSVLTGAVLVYFDGNFEGTLSSLIQNGEKIFDNGYVMAKGDKTRTQSHVLSLELHIATEQSLLGKEFGVRVTTYSRNANYANTILVSDETGFLRAADDINSGLLSSSEGGKTAEKITIALADDITLTSAVTLKNAADIDLCGHKLALAADLTLTGEGTYTLRSSLPAEYDSVDGNGSIVMNNAKGVLEIKDFYAKNKAAVNAGKLYAAKTNLSAFDSESAAVLLAAHAKNALAYGAQAGIGVDLFGALSCYAEKISVTADENCTYANGMLTVKERSGVAVSVLKIGDTEIKFKAIGGEEDAVFASLLANELKYIPDTVSGDAIVYDLFLPKYIPAKNATIEWTSSDESSVTSDGKLADTLKENTVVTLYAKITIGGKTYTHSFTFRVTSQTRETKFKYLVAQLSPVKLTAVYKGESNAKEALFHLPVVSGTYDYRQSFDMIYKSDDVSSADRVWEAFKDIGLQNLSYTVKSGYNFISLDNTGGSAVYLNSATFYTFAQLTVTGDFGGNETYEDGVNVLIQLGNNSELYELAFSFVEKTLGDIDVLQNIIDTRVTYGMKYERGDFYLDGEYQSINIVYAPATENSGISKVEKEGDKWHVYIDPTKFSSAESSVGLSVKVSKDGDETGQSRVLYLSVPAVIKPDDNGFANYSVFSSVKYQTALAISDVADSKTAERVANLPEIQSTDGDTKPNGFTLDGGVLTNATPDYILVRDAANVKSLTFRSGGGETGESEAHTKAYRFARLLKWATGNEKAALPFSFGNYSATDTSSYSDGNEYMSEKEAEILKAYLSGEAGFTDAEVTALWQEATTTPGAHIIGDYTTITQIAAKYSASGSMTYFKYTEVLQWAMNEKDFPNAGGGSAGSPPNIGNIGKYNIDMSGSATANTSSTTLDWSSSPSDWTALSIGSYRNSKYYTTPYVEDNTQYISDYEAQCIMAFWWSISETAGQEYATAFLKACVIPTYLHDDGAGILINAIYEKLLGDADFAVKVTDGIPEISLLDFSTGGISSFGALTSIKVYGELSGDNVRLPAFITTASVNGFFNRVTKLDSDRADIRLKTLAMQACTAGYTTFDLTTISRLNEVNELDFSYNDGISTIGDILNTDIKKISYLDVHKVNVSGTYLTYVLENIKVNSPSASIWYTKPASGTISAARSEFKTEKEKISDELRFLNELTKIDSPYLMLATKANAGNGDKTVQWYVEKGNPAYLVTDGGSDSVVSSLTTAAQMNALLANYYICTEDISFTYDFVTYTLNKNYVYRIIYKNGKFAFDSVGVTAEPGEAPADDSNVDWDSISATNEQGSEKVGETTVDSTAPVYSGTAAEIQAAAEANGAVFTDLTNMDATNPYIDFYNDSGANLGWPKIDGLYRIVHTVKNCGTSATYRYSFSSYKKYSTGYYYQDNSVTNIVFKKRTARYIDYTVTESRAYTLYFVKESVKTGNDLTQILSGTITYVQGTTKSLNMSDAAYFTYDSTKDTGTGGTTTNKYYYKMSDGGAYYEKGNFYTAKFGDTTYEGTDFDELKARVEEAIKALNEDDSLFTTDDSLKRETNVLYNYVGALGGNDDVKTVVDFAAEVKDGFYLYRYAGATGSDDIYVNGTATAMTYTYGGYLLKFGTGGTNATDTTPAGFYFENYAIHTATAAVNMEAILAEANLHKYDALFGNYYGNYYCYAGDTVTVNTRTYTNMYVYRLLTDDDGNFYFEHDNLPEARKTFTEIASTTELMNALVNALAGNSGALKEGAIIHYSGDKASFYANGLFELTYNSETLTYYFKSMGALGNVAMNITTNGSTETAAEFTKSSISGQNLSLDGVSKFTNIRYIGTTSSSFYSGTGGSEEAVIVARIRESDGTVNERKFKVTVSA